MGIKPGGLPAYPKAKIVFCFSGEQTAQDARPDTKFNPLEKISGD